MFHVWCFMFHVSCFMCDVWCFMFDASCLMFDGSCFMFHVWCFMFDVSCFMFHVSCLMSHVSCFMFHVWCLMSGVQALNILVQTALWCLGCLQGASCLLGAPCVFLNSLFQKPCGASGVSKVPPACWVPPVFFKHSISNTPVVPWVSPRCSLPPGCLLCF